MIDKIWRYRSREHKREEVVHISQNLGIPPLIAIILLNRGIQESEMLSFLSKSMKNVRNPLLMNDMAQGAERIVAAIKHHEKIVVYGDYDVDGITATTIMVEFLSSLGAEVDFYIPDRKDEGYGINIKAVNKLIKQGVRLLITVDCGITALGEVSFAKLLGMDVIVTDHHTCKERLPEDAYAVINPKRPDTEYPFDGLAGAGVAFKLMLAIAMNLKMNTTQCFYKYVDVAALGTIADVVPLTDENRIIVDKGIKAIQGTMRPGIRALLNISGADKRPLNALSVAFTIAPRLNAAGRLGTASTGVRLMLSKSEEEAKAIAEELEDENTQRRLTEQKIYDEALEIIAGDINFEKKKVIVLAKKDWHHGVIGIVASRICDLYYKPCILISLNENGEGKGSGRSIPTFNLFDALTHCEDTLSDFGGHSAAAGLSINAASIEAFAQKINKYADNMLSSNDMIPMLDIDCPLNEKDISLETARLLTKLEPFGMSNEKPVFALENVQIGTIDAIGAEHNHLRLKIYKNGKYINCVGFFMSDFINTLHSGDIISIAFNMDINRYQGSETVHLILKDIKPAR